jgi:serine/threonine protein kinase
VLDFGISKIKAARTKLTRATAVIGTPDYMSPEQATGLVEEIDHRTDQWALGCIVWEMLSGHAPFIADDMAALFYQLINMDPHPLRGERRGCRPRLSPCFVVHSPSESQTDTHRSRISLVLLRLRPRDASVR